MYNLPTFAEQYKIDMSVKTIWFIVNPISGTQQKKKVVAKIPEYFPEDRLLPRLEYQSTWEETLWH